MALFTDEERHRVTKDVLRDAIGGGLTNIPWSRPEIWAAVQAIRDVLDSAAFRTSISTAIDSAVTSTPMTAAQKKKLFGYVIKHLFSAATQSVCLPA